MKRDLSMIDDLKIIWFLIGMAVVSALVRFKNLVQFFIDASLGFAMGYSFYLLLGLWIEDGATRSGFVGLVILCSRTIYDCMDRFIKNKLSKILEKRMK
jgi:ABC-type multidrug transport system permease subunit